MQASCEIHQKILCCRSAQLKFLRGFDRLKLAANTIQIFPLSLIHLLQLLLACEPHAPFFFSQSLPRAFVSQLPVRQYVTDRLEGRSFQLSDHAGHMFIWQWRIKATWYMMPGVFAFQAWYTTSFFRSFSLSILPFPASPLLPYLLPPTPPAGKEAKLQGWSGYP